MHQLGRAQLYEEAILNNNQACNVTRPSCFAENGCLVSFSGVKTGRSPKDKRIVKDATTEKEIWWGNVNMPIPTNTFKLIEQRVVDYLSTRPKIYVVDGFVGADPKYRYRIRIICGRPYHALFMRNMLIVPTKEEHEKEFQGEMDFVVMNGGEFPNNKTYEGTGTTTCPAVNFADKKLCILGTQYAGCMKKGVFTVMNYLLPKRGILSMHASANEGKNGDVTILFGLSGTGKTTLSADPNRPLIGDDEHGWTDDGVFNIEGGCYAKCIHLSREKEPEIYDALRFGTVLENIDFHDMHSREVNFDGCSITENTRASYPLEFIANNKLPAVGGQPKNILFLTCDAFGVLPPVSKLNFEQAMYHFISGYTAKVAGTEVGITEPQLTFSACFGEAFYLFTQMFTQNYLLSE
jgi:phosphoenolpyruvate carboxykinase (ATP)